MAIRNWFKREPKRTYETLVIYMKSGNKIVINNVYCWKVKGTGKGLTELAWEQDHVMWETKLIPNALDLTQVEAITTIRTS
jgi:hypothetical protein